MKIPVALSPPRFRAATFLAFVAAALLSGCRASPCKSEGKTYIVGEPERTNPSDRPGPSRGKVFVVGEVYRPGFHELYDGTTLTEVLNEAGCHADSCLAKVALKRPTANGYRHIALGFAPPEEAKDAKPVVLQDGDMIHVPDLMFMHENHSVPITTLKSFFVISAEDDAKK